MKYYGSVVNRVMEAEGSRIKPEVGMGVTEYLWSDRHAYEVVKVIDDRHLMIRRMKTKLLGHYLDQDYEYSSDPDAREIKIFLTKKGEWRQQYGRQLGDTRFGVGFACEYRDPSF